MRHREAEDALARNDRYVREAVEALNLCPFAARARREGTSARRVLFGRLEEVPQTTLLGILRDMEREGGPEVVQLIFPDETDDPGDWERRAKAGLVAVHEALGRSVAGVAALHPRARFKVASARAMVPLFRRAPDPTLQWISLAALKRVREGRPHGEVLLPRDPAEARALLASLERPSLADTIADTNRERALSYGVEALETLFESFARGEQALHCPGSAGTPQRGPDRRDR